MAVRTKLNKAPTERFVADVKKIRERARRIVEDILKVEEEHADDMANLLAKVG
jgi:hypothetical protein